MTITKPCGTWKSAITSEMLVGGAVRLGEIVTDGDDVWWAESRPDEGGRTVLVCNGKDQTDRNTDVRTLVHEYGGSHPTSQEMGLFRNFGDLVLSGSPDPKWSEIVLKTQKVLMACIESSKQDGARVEL